MFSRHGTETLQSKVGSALRLQSNIDVQFATSLVALLVVWCCMRVYIEGVYPYTCPFCGMVLHEGLHRAVPSVPAASLATVICEDI